MNDLEITSKPSMFKLSLKYGILLGLLLIASNLFFQYIVPDSGRLNLWISIIILLVGVYLSSKSYRDNFKGGYLTYSQALGFGTLTFFISSVVLGLFTFILFQFIYPEGIEVAMQEAELEIIRRQPDISDQELESALSLTRVFVNPVSMGIFSLLFYSFLGFLGSLITSALVKREESYEG